jgi:hypothetical protein
MDKKFFHSQAGISSSPKESFLGIKKKELNFSKKCVRVVIVRSGRFSPKVFIALMPLFLDRDTHILFHNYIWFVQELNTF